ncbi:MAG: antA/AntB antirepressor family protein [Terrisporobacter sp.]|uniref:antA/AntB antirepressor family protein n=1 Tax=Terrisporobacter sp. TaxID=1965305 RepID=UPI002A90DF4D|nr:antA/AntB antirepressor family protein [Terrisporobacter sp.]MDY6153705.1 antA/AntB antirepressor family protein [Terrisporobacter sp.]
MATGKNRVYNEEDYIITIDMAKEICMIQRSDIGREFRKYFIECEKQLKEVKSNIPIIKELKNIKLDVVSMGSKQD